MKQVKISIPALESRDADQNTQIESEMIEQIKQKYFLFTILFFYASFPRINSFTDQICLLKTRILELEKLNEEMLLEDGDSHRMGPSSVHSFYQDIFITDLQKELAQKDDEISSIKQQLLKQSTQFKQLQEKNEKSMKIIRMYREMVRQREQDKNSNLK
jgi:hypothetical protein